MGLVTSGRITAVDGSTVRVEADSICVHEDSPGAVAMAERVRVSLAEAGVEVTAFVDVSMTIEVLPCSDRALLVEVGDTGMIVAYVDALDPSTSPAWSTWCRPPARCSSSPAPRAASRSARRTVRAAAPNRRRRCGPRGGRHRDPRPL